MNKGIVVDTSPLLAFAKMEVVEAIGELPFDFYSPEEIEKEILAGIESGFQLAIPEWLNIAALGSVVSPIAVASLDKGEASVIQLAIERSIETVCIDEIKGRRAASAVGLKVVGSLGLLGKAKSVGLIAEVKPYIQKAVANGIFYDKKLIDFFLKSIGE